MAYITKSLKLSVICILLMAAAASCTGEKPTREPGFVNVTLAIPGSPKVINETKHGAEIDGSLDESKIRTMTFFVFKSDNSRELYKTVAINDNNTSSDPMWDGTKLSMRLLLTPGQKTIYAIANWSLTPIAEMPDLSSIVSPAVLTKAVRLHNNITPSGVAPVMSGSLPVNIVGGDQNLKISLTRQIARIDIYPMISKNMETLGATVSVEGVRFINMAQQAYIFPQTPVASPSTAIWEQINYSGSSSGTVTATTKLAAIRYPTSYYIPEYFGSSGSATTMIIKVCYNDTDTYYSIPVNGQTGAAPSLYAVERNHIYEYYVTIQGIGSESSAFNPFDIREPGVANVKYITEIR